MKLPPRGSVLASRSRKGAGFTLIELLVVIAIIAILSIVVILTLNPAELLRQARDSNRISDLSTLRSAVSLYLADVRSPSLVSSTVGYACYLDGQAATNTCAGAGGWFKTVAATSSPSAASQRKVDGNGWIPIDFTQISSGAPFGNLPVDPLKGNPNQFYAYTASTSPLLSFKLVAFMESLKYSASGTNDVESTDGGSYNFAYEVGTNLNL